MKGSLPVGSLITALLLAVGCSSSDSGGRDAASGGSTGVGNNGTGAGTQVAGSTSSGGGTTGAGGSAPNANCPGGFVVDTLENQALWGNWFPFNDATAGGTQSPVGAFMAEQDPALPALGYVAHTSGDGYTNWGAGLGLNLKGVEGCFDKSQTNGLKFKAKGSGYLTIAAIVPGTVPPANGGTCMGGDLCFDTHKIAIPLQADWLQYEIDFDDLRQTGWGEAATFDPAQTMTFQFSMTQMPFDFWMDDVEFRQGTYVPPDIPMGGSGGTGGTPEIPITGVLADTLKAETFNGMFPGKNSFYTYEGLIAAATKFPAFACQGDATTKAREVAAFLGNVALETGHLVHIEEQSPQGDYCKADDLTFPCEPGKTYIGRGPLQLSWNYNYGAAAFALQRPLLKQPELVATDPAVSWEAALWFWMTVSSGGKTPHQVMVNNEGFGGTIRVINGAIECDGGDPGTVQDRVNNYTTFCTWWSVSPGDNLSC
jgi:hypothetical protein